MMQRRESLLELAEHYVQIRYYLKDFRESDEFFDESKREEQEQVVEFYRQIYSELTNTDGSPLHEQMSFEDYVDSILESTEKEIILRRQN